MIYQGVKVHCAGCGSTDVRFVYVLIECRNCGLAMLSSEFPLWKNDWMKLPISQPKFSRLKALIRIMRGG